MDIREILECGPSLSSIKKIDKYLTTLSPTSRDYPRALAHLAYLTYQLGNVSEAFSLLYGYLDKCPFKEKTVIYDTLIKIYYLANDYSHVKEMIEAKKPYLPSYYKSGYYEDLIKYYYFLGDKHELLKNLLIYLDDDISDERRLKALFLLNSIYKKENDLAHFKIKNELMKNLALSTKDNATYNEAIYNEAYIAYKEADYENCLNKIDEILETNISQALKARLLALKLSSLIYLGDYRKASIFEAQYDKEILAADKETRLFFIKECMRLYNLLGNRYNYNIYEKMLNETEEENKTATIKPQTKKKNPKKIDFTFLDVKNDITTEYNAKPIKEEEQVEVVIKRKKIIREEGNTIDIGIMLEDLVTLFKKINETSVPTNREYIRLLLSMLNKIACFDECYILMKDKAFKGLYFKKDRLYDKENVNIEGTFLQEVFNRLEEQIILDSLTLATKEINTGKAYNELEKCSLISFLMGNNVILFTAKEEQIITKNLNYEKLKIASCFIEKALLDETKNVMLQEKYADYSFMLDHFTSGYKRQSDNVVYLSKEAAKMFGLKEVALIDELYDKIDSSSRLAYKGQINYLLTHKVEELSFRFYMNGSYYQESFKSDGLGHILSMLEDLTRLKKEEEDNFKMATTDPLSKGYNKAKFYYDLTDFFDLEKCTIFILSMKNFQLYCNLYGVNFGNQLIYAMQKFLSDNTDLKVYHLELDQFVLVNTKEVDKRSMLKRAKLIVDVLKKRLYELNNRVDSYFNIGVLRLKTDIKETDKDKIMSYLSSTLKCDENKNLEHSINLFSMNSYKRDVYEAQIITHLSESIDHNHLRLTYKQVVDLEKGNCDHYRVALNLSNFATSDEELRRIIKRRNKTIEIEKYIIHKALYEIKEIYKVIHLYINVSLNISYETLTSNLFCEYLIEQLNFFGVSMSALSINYDDIIDSYSLEALNELMKKKIMLSSNNLNLLKEYPLTYFYYKIGTNVNEREDAFIHMINEYCLKNTTNLVIDGVNNQNVISRFSTEGIKLYAGRIYNANVTKDDILKAFLA